MYEEIKKTDIKAYEILMKELERQQKTIGLIASENYASKAVMEASGCIMTNKYAEGYPGKRYYAGNKYIDEMEMLAIERAKKLFGAEHANVQPHAGATANLAAYLAFLQPGDKIMGLALDHGGHLTHGYKVSFSGKWFVPAPYYLNKETEMLDYDMIRKRALEERPKLIIAGYSAYPRIIDWKAFREIADEVGAYLMADIAHIAGLVAGGAHPSPVPYADVVTTTTHKTLRGPRGALILTKEKYAKQVDSAVFPGAQGGPLENAIAAKAVCFEEALKPEFKEYAKKIVENAKTMADEFVGLGYRLVSGGTDNHLMLIDLRSIGITGADAQAALEKADIILNKNGIPYDPLPPVKTSGIRIGTPMVTTRGMGKSEMKEIAILIHKVLSNINDESVIAKVREDVHALTEKFPIYV
ncbi:MAG: serine hydroxymethyltransferase [Candidatus Anstonellales archaeon]